MPNYNVSPSTMNSISIAKLLSKLKPGEKLDFDENCDGTAHHCAEIINTSFGATLILVGMYGGTETQSLDITGLRSADIEEKCTLFMQEYFNYIECELVYIDNAQKITTEWEMPLKTNGWQCTDPDCYQYQRTITLYRFNMAQAVEMPDGTYRVVKSEINLSDYSKAEIDAHIDMYYSPTGTHRPIRDSIGNGIIAEFIFESLSPIDYDYQYVAKNEAEARRIILDILT